MNRTRFFIFTFLVTGIFCWADPAAAQTDPRIATAIQVAPARLEWNLDAGATRSGTLNIKNYSDRHYDIEISVEDFQVAADSSRAQFFRPNPDHPLAAYDVINWIGITPQISLGPKESRNVTFDVRVPEQTPTGGYYGVIFVKAKPQPRAGEPADKSGSQITAYAQMGVLLTLGVQGAEPIRQAAAIESFLAGREIFWNSPAIMQGVIANRGNVPFKGSAKISIEKFGSTVKELNFSPQVMYPGKTRNFDADWDFPTWTFGRYVAKLQFTDEHEDIRLAREISFWIISWRAAALFAFLAVLFFIFFAAGIVVYRNRQRLSKAIRVLLGKE